LAVADAIFLAGDFQRSGGPAIIESRNGKTQIKPDHAAKRTAMRGDVFSRRHERQRGGQDIGCLGDDGTERRASGHVPRIRHTIGLKNEEAPISAIIGRNVGLSGMISWKRGDGLKLARDCHRLIADRRPCRGKARRIREMLRCVQHRWTIDPAVIDLPTMFALCS